MGRLVPLDRFLALPNSRLRLLLSGILCVLAEDGVVDVLGDLAGKQVLGLRLRRLQLLHSRQHAPESTSLADVRNECPPLKKDGRVCC